MKRVITLAGFLFLVTVATAQQTLDEKIEQGIAFHDKKEYTSALAMYNEVLEADSNHFMALYEKAFTLSILLRHSETVAICEKLNRLYPFEPQLKNVYVTWGSALDYLGEPDESIRVYDLGLEEFPDFYLLHFNKAITYAKMGRIEESKRAVEESLKRNALHGSSHNLLATILLKENKVASLISSLTFLAIEPTTQRSVSNLKQVEMILNGNVTKGEGNKINVNIDMNLMDTSKSRENNFSSVELMMSLSAALDQGDLYKDETKPQRLFRKLDDLISMMWEMRKDGNGIYWTVYVPFLREMQQKKFLEVYSHIAYASSKDKENTQWIDKHSKEIEDFFGWVRSYRW